ncbi:thioredoxin family protein [Portibacter lacus]|uniref:Thioredoxin n=1 Tax=Portibacter lacus TaxID=1099794 RepID=A0AA37SQQ1_9BACT|nr:thioredoxin family protein [Portibacter lacus]GLR18112.1 thioredoxin [Portibacter lacus]
MRTNTAINYQQYFEKGISFEEYLKRFAAEIALGEGSPFAQYLPQNWQRQNRLIRKIKLNEDLQKAIDDLKQPVNWLLITEHWCGDASQINPVILKAAEESNGKIDLRISYRDENEELIDAHLTDGRSRSIPILVQLDENYNLLNTYGPRPAEAQLLVMDLLSKGEDYNIPLHTWYAKDRQKAIQEDLVKLIESAV